jgi:hypothetical protein
MTEEELRLLTRLGHLASESVSLSRRMSALMTDEELEAMEHLFRDRLNKLEQGRSSAPPAPVEYVRSGLLEKGFSPSVVELALRLNAGAEPTIDWEAKEMVETLRIHLRTGSLTPTMVRLLDAFLGNLVENQRWALLGLNSPHRRKSKGSQEDNATSAFAEAVVAGRSEQDAEIAAYDAYFAAAPRKDGRPRPTYAADSLKSSAGFHSLAAKRMKQVRQCLVKIGFIEPGKRGRPKK